MPIWNLMIILTISLKIIICPWILEKELKIVSTKSERKSLCQSSTFQVGICFTYLESIKNTQLKQLEQAQRTAARWVTNQSYNPHNPSSVTEMINHLKWPSLQQHRVWADVTLEWADLLVSNCHFLSLSHWYPGSGVVLDCIDSWSLHPYF